jgi:hypothetical protein
MVAKRYERYRFRIETKAVALFYKIASPLYVFYIEATFITDSMIKKRLFRLPFLKVHTTKSCFFMFIVLLNLFSIIIKK